MPIQGALTQPSIQIVPVLLLLLYLGCFVSLVCTSNQKIQFALIYITWSQGNGPRDGIWQHAVVEPRLAGSNLTKRNVCQILEILLACVGYSREQGRIIIGLFLKHALFKDGMHSYLDTMQRKTCVFC